MKINKLLSFLSTLSLLFTLTFCNPKEVKVEYKGEPSNIISVAQAVKMHDEYQEKIGKLIENSHLENDNEIYPATQYTYIDLDTLKRYVAFLDKVQKLNNKKITGLRIYFGAYPSVQEMQNLNFKTIYPGRETIFMAPTMKGQDSPMAKQYRAVDNVPFYIKPKGSDKLVGDYLVIDELLCKYDMGKRKVQNLVAVDTTRTAKTSLIINRLDNCPPPK